jgi:hypothetical protein
MKDRIIKHVVKDKKMSKYQTTINKDNPKVKVQA